LFLLNKNIKFQDNSYEFIFNKKTCVQCYIYVFY
jgi:hypothetical protein